MTSSTTTPDYRLLTPRHWPAWLAMGLLWLLGRLPWRLMYPTAWLMGGALYWLAPFRRRVARINIERCFPEMTPAQQQRLVREAFTASFMGLIESSFGWWSRDRRFDGLFEVQGLDRLQQAVAQGRGVILMGGHFSCLDLAGRGITRLQPAGAIYRRQKYPVFDRVIRRGRERLLQPLLERDDTRGIIRALKQGHILWYAADQDFGPKHSVFAPFFGIQTATITAARRLARINDSPVLFFSHHRKRDGSGYILRIQGPLTDFPSADAETDARVQNALLEEAIRHYPEQYLWLHKRFKTRPPGEAPFYPRKRRKRRRSRDLR